MENLFRAIALDVINLAPGKNSMEAENFGAIWEQANSIIPQVVFDGSTVAKFKKTRLAWQQYIFIQEEAIEETPAWLGIIHAQRKYILATIKDKYIDLDLVAPNRYQVPGVFSLTNFAISSNIGMGFLSLFHEGFGSYNAQIVPKMGLLNIQAIFADGGRKNCTMESVTELNVVSNPNIETPITNEMLEEYLPKVKDFVHTFAPYFDQGDLEADYEACLIFESRNEYHIRQKKQSIIKLGLPANLEFYRVYFLLEKHAPQSEESISILIRSSQGADGIIKDALLMFFEPTDTLDSFFKRLALNYYGVDSEKLLDEDLVQSLLKNMAFAHSSKITNLEMKSLQSNWNGKLKTDTQWSEVIKIAGLTSKDPSKVDLVAYLDLETLDFRELIAPSRFDCDLMLWDSETMGSTAKPSLKLSYSSMYNLSLRLQGHSNETTVEWPEIAPT